MAYTQSDIDRLKRALASPELEVEGPDGARVRYRTADELRKIIADAQAEVSAAAAGQARSATKYFRPVLSRER